MPKQPAPKTRFIDRPEVSEVFADSIRAISFDGQTMRIEFCVTRMDEPIPPNPQTGKQYPVCRVVLTPNTGINLFSKLQQIMQELEKRGAIKRGTPTPQTVQ